MCFPHPSLLQGPPPQVLPTLPEQVSDPGISVNGLQQILGPAPRGRSHVTTVVPNPCCVVRERGGHGGVNKLAGVLFYFKVACQFLECKRAS